MSNLEREELYAIISHWCQSCGSIRVPLLTEEIRNKCLELMSCSQKLKETQAIRENLAPYQQRFDFKFDDIPYPPLAKWNFKFIDLFAGIGGFRLAFQSAGGKCVFSSEWDKYAKKTYNANFGEVPYGDIRAIDKNQIPDHDILCAGFPCQPFSLAGVSKKKSLGLDHGFKDETQGTLFFEIKEIIKKKRPKAFMLENVKNLISHDKGKTFEVIRHSLERSLGYVINWKVIDGGNWVPQHRERIFIVGYDPDQIQMNKNDIIIPEKPSKGYIYPELKSIIRECVEDHTIGPGTWETLKRHKKKHAEKGNGFGYGIHKLPLKKGSVTRTISARYHKDGAEILIDQENNRPRRLTVEEAMQLQGYDPEKFVFPVSKTQAYKQIGNSVVVPAVSACANEIVKVIIGYKNDCNEKI
ncbi:MAG: DNA (cytosine-5-)-methyltransferase [Desulfobacteraceae bacterium]